jgi:hypothetical protein
VKSSFSSSTSSSLALSKFFREKAETRRSDGSRRLIFGWIGSETLGFETFGLLTGGGVE